MGLPLSTIRLTVRRRGGDGQAVYPRVIRDSAATAKIAVAIRHCDSMVGKTRADFDDDVLSHFFGDVKVARSIIVCLARSYRYRAPAFSGLLLTSEIDALTAAGCTSPRTVRLAVFDRLNAERKGFLPFDDRIAFMTGMEATFGLRSGLIERLWQLDAPEHAVLQRIGAMPRPEDVVAQYNFGVVEGLLRHACDVHLWLTTPAAASDAITQLCALQGVAARLEQEPGRLALTLLGRQDALGSWARHGRRVARVVVQLLERGGAEITDGSATIALPGRTACLRLTRELLDLLTGERARPTGWNDADGWTAADIARALTPQGSRRGGWRIRRAPDAQAWSGGVVVPDFLAVWQNTRLLVCIVRSISHAERLAQIAPLATSGDPFLFVGARLQVGPLVACGARVVIRERLDVPDLFAQIASNADGGEPATEMATGAQTGSVGVSIR